MGYEYFGEKIIFPSTPVPGVNNDQSLTLLFLNVLKPVIQKNDRT